MEREQTFTEKKVPFAGTPYDKYDVGEIINGQVAMDRNFEAVGKKLGEKVNKYGRDGKLISEFRNKGKDARIAAIPFSTMNFDNEIERNNCWAGFVENGNRILMGMLDKLTPEQLEAYGKNDFVSGITYDEIPDALKENTTYIVAYTMASITGEKTGKRGK